jgi:hypothetical protein
MTAAAPTATMSVRFFCRRSALCMVLLPWCCSVQAQDATEVRDGIHIHRMGTTGVGQAYGEDYLQAMRERCEGALAQASGTAQAFSFSGNLRDTVRIETQEYFAPSLKMRATQVTTYPLVGTAVCRFEVARVAIWKLRHFTSTGYTDFQQLVDRKNGMRWQRSVHTLPAPRNAAAMLKRALLPGAKVSTELGARTIAGRQCKLTEVALAPGSIQTLCLLSTETPFPGTIVLANKHVSGKTLVMDEQAALVELHAALPLALFYPPAGASIEDLPGGANRPDTQVQKGCPGEQGKTGVNPCVTEALAHEN